jgi:hypothetical protein
MMKALLLVLLSGGVSDVADAPMIPAFFTGERLYEVCAGPDETQCWMYVAGVLDGVFETETGTQKRTICGAEITNREAANRVTAYLRENEAIREKAAAVVVRMALQSELACTADKA